MRANNVFSYTFEEKIDHLFLPVMLDASMESYFAFPVTKRTVARVCRVRNVEVGIIEVREQPW